MTNSTHRQNCTVRIEASGNRGTGFFVAPQLILTCYHVVKNHESVDIFWKGNQDQAYTATVEKRCEHADLALLKLDCDNLEHPCVEFDLQTPQNNDNLSIFGYPKDKGVDYPEGDSSPFKFGGESFQDGIKYYNLENTKPVFSGFSGSPIWNNRTNKVCGITRLSQTYTGARGISTEVILQKLPDLQQLNQNFHQQQKDNSNYINPFQYGSSVPPQSFYGRKKAILDLKNRIGAITPQSINIVGLRRNGKTSLLRYIQECPQKLFLDNQKPLIVNLDLQSRRFNTPRGIMEGLRREVAKITGNEPWKKEENEDDWAVEDGLENLFHQGYRLIILLDEFEAISQYLEQFQGWGDDWRAKASAGLLTMVIASKRPLEEIYQNVGVGSPFGNIFSRTILGTLETEAWQKLIRDGFITKPFFNGDKSLKWIEDISGGLPFYVQMAGAILWQYEDFEKAEKEFKFQAQPRFKELWDDLTQSEKQALRYHLDISNIPQPSKSITDNLKRHGLLTETGRIFSSAFIEFIKEK